MPEKEKKPKSLNERVAKHRQREKERMTQVALAISRIVLGEEAGDASRALADFLEKQSKAEHIPEDYQEMMFSAAEKLRRKRRY